jgi:hypothetical protein
MLKVILVGRAGAAMALMIALNGPGVKPLDVGASAGGRTMARGATVVAFRLRSAFRETRALRRSAARGVWLASSPYFGTKEERFPQESTRR